MMVEFNNPSISALSNENYYSDAELERLLKESKDSNLSQLIRLQMLIAEKYAAANEAYQQENSHIKLQIKRYYFKILIVFFVELLRIIRGKAPKAKHTQLRDKKRRLKESFHEQKGHFDDQMSAVKHGLDAIKDLVDEVSRKEEQLEIFREIINNADSELNQQEKALIQEKIDFHVQERDRIILEINGLYQEIEAIFNTLTDFIAMGVGQLSHTYWAAQKVHQQGLIEQLKQESKQMKHELADKLEDFLIYQTRSSLQAFRNALLKDQNYHDNRALTDLIWSAAAFYPELTAGLDRVAGLSEYITAKIEELSALNDLIEQTDVAIHEKNKVDIYKKQLDGVFLVQRDKLMNDITQLYHAHHDLLTDLDLIASCQKIDKMVSPNVMLLIAECAQLNHPLAAKLRCFLTYQTQVSLDDLKDAMAKDGQYQESKELTAIIWDAGAIFPDIIEGLVREEVLPSILESQDAAHADIFMQHMEASVRLESEIAEAMAKKAELREIIAAHEEAAILWNKDLHHIYKEREIARGSPDPDASQIRALTQEAMKTVGCLAKNARKQEKVEAELAKIEAQIVHLRAHEAQQAQLIRHIPPKFKKEELLALQHKCKTSAWFEKPHPVVVALSQFLNHATPTLLGKLKGAMESYPNYKTHANIMQLLDEASHFFPVINQPSPLHTATFFKKDPVIPNAQTTETSDANKTKKQ